MTRSTQAPLSPREVFARFQQAALANTPDAMADLYAEDAVVEQPFARPGTTRRIQGREEFRARAKAARESPWVRIEEFRDVVVHETSDPEVIIVEYGMAGTATSTGRSGAAPFVLVLRVKDGKVVLWREYQNVLAMAEAMGQAPAP